MDVVAGDPVARAVVQQVLAPADGAARRFHGATVLRRALSFLAELWAFMRVRKKYWLFPVIVMALVLGGLIVLSQTSAVAPMVYTIF